MLRFFFYRLFDHHNAAPHSVGGWWLPTILELLVMRTEEELAADVDWLKLVGGSSKRGTCAALFTGKKDDNTKVILFSNIVFPDKSLLNHMLSR